MLAIWIYRATHLSHQRMVFSLSIHIPLNVIIEFVASSICSFLKIVDRWIIFQRLFHTFGEP